MKSAAVSSVRVTVAASAVAAPDAPTAAATTAAMTARFAFDLLNIPVPLRSAWIRDPPLAAFVGQRAFGARIRTVLRTVPSLPASSRATATAVTRSDPSMASFALAERLSWIRKRVVSPPVRASVRDPT